MIPPLLPAGYGFLLALFRFGGLFMAAPLFGARQVPARIRLGLALAVAFAAYAAAGAPAVSVPESILGLVFQSGGEAALGLAAGLASRFALDALMAAGQVAGLSMGLGYGAVVDPTNGVESAAVGQLLNALALGTAATMGVHREAIAWGAASLRALPPGAAISLTLILQGAARQALFSVALGARLVFPILGATTLGHVVLGLLGRSANQLNLSSVGFAVSILAGGGALYLLAPSLAEVAAQAAVSALAPP
jgi:flagellar biosynthetic protein FliR